MSVLTTRTCTRSSCAELNPGDAVYCETCGSQLVTIKPRCEFCGRKITYGAKRCMAHRSLPDPYEVPA